MEELGWTSTLQGVSGSSVEAVFSDGWAVARVWSVVGVLRGTRLPAHMARAIFTVDGDASITVNGTPFSLHPGEAIVVQGTDHVTAENQKTWARFEWQFHSPDARTSAPVPFAMPDEYQHLVGAITNSLVANPTVGRAHGAPLLLEALSGSLAAAQASAEGRPITMSTHRFEQYRQATRLIDEHHADQGFSVQNLCNLMAVSTSTLHALFNAAGSTPRQGIEQRRLRSALSQLRRIHAPGRGVYESVAEKSGFTSAKQLRLAIARQDRRENADLMPLRRDGSPNNAKTAGLADRAAQARRSPSGLSGTGKLGQIGD